MIEVTNLVKRYGDRNVVDNLSFTVEKGQIVGFLGPNGAGKSTTMNIITGYISATSGTVKVNGYDIYDDPEKAKACIGYLPEQPPVYPDMKVREYLSFVADLKKVKKSEKEKKIRYVMKSTKIMDVSERLIKHLSKGYKQRVGFAQAIIGYPEVIILDEPTVGLDPKQIIEIRELIRELAKKHTVILSSHILSEVSAVCDHIMIISKGKLVASDTPEGLMTVLNGGKELVLSVEGTKEVLSSVLDTMKDIQEYHVTEEKENTITTVVIRTDAQHDVRKELFYAMAEKKLPILELSQNEKSLEDVFLELTGEQKEEETVKESVEEETQIVETEEAEEEKQDDSNI